MALSWLLRERFCLALRFGVRSSQPNGLVVTPNGAGSGHSVYGSGWNFHRWLGDAYGNASTPFADAGLFALSALAAIPGADAPTLSLARLSADGAIPTPIAARGVILVASATTFAKVGILLAVSRGPFVRRVAVTLAAISAVGVGLFVWMG